MKKKLMSLLLCVTMVASMVIGCGGGDKDTEAPDATKEIGEIDSELPTIIFTHGYYHDESEWPAAAQMRAIYQELQMHIKMNSTLWL